MNRSAKLVQRASRGFSLVELMVAMTIGLIIMAAVSTIFVDTKKNYVVQDALARLQENGRFAMDAIVRDVRMAGYYGCSDDVSSIKNTLNGAAAGDAYDISNPLQGSEGKSPWYPVTASATPPNDMRAGSDAIAVRYLDRSTSIQITSPYMPNTSAALHIASGNGLKQGDVVFVTSCSGGAMFQITGPNDPNDGTVVHNTGSGTPGNSTKDLGTIFEGKSNIAKYYYAMYYIAPGLSGEYSLFRQTMTTTGVLTDELIEGVEDLEILYGEDTANSDRVPDVYRKASAVTNWGNVVTVRIGLLARTLANSDKSTKDYGAFQDTTDGYDVDGDGVKETNYALAKNDQYQRRIFRATVTLRNKQ